MKLVHAITNLLAAPLFRTEAGGQRVFKPSAVSGKGFIIPDPAAEDRLRLRLARLMGVSALVSLILIAGTIAVFGAPRDWTAPVWLGIAAAFLAHFVINIRLGRGLTRDLAVGVDEAPVGFLRAMTDQAVAWPRWMNWLQAIVGPMVLWGGLLGYQDAATTYDLVLSVMAVPLGLLMIAFAVTGLVTRR